MNYGFHTILLFIYYQSTGVTTAPSPWSESEGCATTVDPSVELNTGCRSPEHAWAWTDLHDYPDACETDCEENRVGDLSLLQMELRMTNAARNPSGEKPSSRTPTEASARTAFIETAQVLHDSHLKKMHGSDAKSQVVHQGSGYAEKRGQESHGDVQVVQVMDNAYVETIRGAQDSASYNDQAPDLLLYTTDAGLESARRLPGLVESQQELRKGPLVLGLQHARAQSAWSAVGVALALLLILILAMCFMNHSHGHVEDMELHIPRKGSVPEVFDALQRMGHSGLADSRDPSMVSLGPVNRNPTGPWDAAEGRLVGTPPPPIEAAPVDQAGLIGPPPICPSLILPSTKAAFMISMEGLLRGTNHALDIIGLSGMKLLDASIQGTPDGRRSLVLTSVGIQDLCTCVFPPQAPGIAASPAHKTLEVYGRGGRFYGAIEPSNTGRGSVLKCNGKPVLIVEKGNVLDLEMSAMTVSRQVLAHAGRAANGRGPDSGDVWKLQVSPGIDAVLIAACMLSMILLWSDGLPGRPSTAPGAIMLSPTLGAVPPGQGSNGLP